MADFPIYQMDTLIIGSGCAGFNAADWLYTLGRKDIAIVTEGIDMGTSRNTGSDKQTYYKLSLAGGDGDSVREMAKTLHDGGMNGDIALTEAACSVKSFYKLANLGVPFPTNEYGEYVGYKTDHDPRQRATSAGPLTSRYMTQCLQKAVEEKQIKIFDGFRIVKIVTENNRVCGAVAIDKKHVANENMGLVMFQCQNIIAATGGPAAVYDSSVYPQSQTGATGMLLEAGAAAANLQEWQYGMASVKFRWNVSGTYQQVLPKYIAVDQDGNEREFLPEYFSNPADALKMVFLKGYQWPFDVNKVDGSSVIDLIVHHETINKGNRVFMDFRKEPSGLEDGFEALGDEAYNYLKNSDALLETPIKRLEKMNPKAIELYRSHNIDLYTEPLEIKVCAQHNNGGIMVDTNWQSSVEGLYAAGEAAGTFGVYRPGGSALNSTQVGSMRAAEHIAYKECVDCGENTLKNVEKVAKELYRLLKDVWMRNAEQDMDECSCGDDAENSDESINERNNISSHDMLAIAQKLMSAGAAHLREKNLLLTTQSEIEKLFSEFWNIISISKREEIPYLFMTRDTLITQRAVLNAILKTVTEIGSRGSGLAADAQNGQKLNESLPFQVIMPKDAQVNRYSITKWNDGDIQTEFQNTCDIPEADNWFERVWARYNERTSKQ